MTMFSCLGHDSLSFLSSMAWQYCQSLVSSKKMTLKKGSTPVGRRRPLKRGKLTLKKEQAPVVIEENVIVIMLRILLNYTATAGLKCNPAPSFPTHSLLPSTGYGLKL